MAMRPMMNDRRTITHADMLVVSALFAAAVLLMLLAQALGLTVF